MYDFPDCKYTYFSLIDKSLGHLFHLPASIRTKTRLEYPLSKTPSQFARFPVTKFRHDSQPRRPHHDPPRQKKSRPRLSEKSLRDRNTPHPYTRPKADSRFSLRNVLLFGQPPPKTNAPQKHQTKITPYNVSSRALAAILSPSLSVYFTSIGRYFFSSFTLPEDLAMRTRFLIAVRSSGLIFNTLL